MKVAIKTKNSLKGMNTEAFEDPIIKKYNSTKELLLQKDTEKMLLKKTTEIWFGESLSMSFGIEVY